MNQAQFDELANEWEGQIQHLSNSHTIMGKSACRELARAGREIVPFCLKRLKRKDAGLNWCHLLREVTGENPASPPPKPVTPGATSGFVAYDVNANIKAWIEWGKKDEHIREVINELCREFQDCNWFVSVGIGDGDTICLYVKTVSAFDKDVMSRKKFCVKEEAYYFKDALVKIIAVGKVVPGNKGIHTTE